MTDWFLAINMISAEKKWANTSITLNIHQFQNSTTNVSSIAPIKNKTKQKEGYPHIIQSKFT